MSTSNIDSQPDWQWETRFKGCNNQNAKHKFSNYLCNTPTHRWVRVNTQTGKKIVRKVEENPRHCRSVNPKSQTDGYICNPSTGRWVGVDSRVGKMLAKNYNQDLLKNYLLEKGMPKKGMPQKGMPKKGGLTGAPRGKAALQALKKPVQLSISFPKNYQPIKKIGSGLSSQIYLAREKTSGNTVVIKRYNNPIQPLIAEQMSNQVANLTTIDSEYLLKYIGSDYDPDSRTFFLIMEYFDGSNLLDFDWKKMNLEDQMQIILQLILGLYDLHIENHLAHQEIKPTNILISSDGSHIRYIGYGLTPDLQTWKKNYNLASGEPYYRSPENIISVSNVTLQLLQASDIWSLGAIIYYIFTGLHAFERPGQQSIDDINQTIITEKPTIELLPPQLGQNKIFRTMFSRIFNKDPVKRIKIAQIVDLYSTVYEQIATL